MFVNKARKNLVDGKLSSIIDKVLPSGFGLDKYAQIIKGIRKEGGGAEKAIDTIVKVADTALDLIPGGGTVKVAAKLAKCLLKLW